MSKFCTNCNSELNDDAKFCPNCGTSLGVPSENNVMNEAVNTVQPQPEPVVYQTQPDAFSYQAPQQNIPSYQPVNPAYPNNEIPQSPSKAMAIISMITGILSLVCCCSGTFGLILGIASVALGIISLATKKGGKGMAIAGLICGGLGFLGGLSSYLAIWGAYSGDLDFDDFEDVIEDLFDSLGMGGIF